MIYPPIQINFEKKVTMFIREFATNPNKVFYDDLVQIHRVHDGIQFVQRPTECFDNLHRYSVKSNYAEIDGLMMHYLNERPKDVQIILLLHGQAVWRYLFILS